MGNKKSGERTKGIIAESFKNILQKKSIDKIKIQEIADASGVNRQTFYYHFDDIYALLKWTTLNDVKNLREMYSDSDDYIAVVTDIYDYITDNKAAFLNILNSKAHEVFEDFILNIFTEGMKAVIENLEESNGVNEYYKDFIAQFYANAIYGITITWLKSNSVIRMSPDDLIKVIDIVATGNIKRSLLKCRDV